MGYLLGISLNFRCKLQDKVGFEFKDNFSVQRTLSSLKKKTPSKIPYKMVYCICDCFR